MKKGIFITATGTDIGKTFVTSLIVKKLREYGLNAGYYKAALSGGEKTNGELIEGDAKYVCHISGLEYKPKKYVSFTYEKAVSPHLASKIEGNPVNLLTIESDFKKIKTEFDYITVEGSGGIVCPLRIDDKVVMLTDVIKLLNLDVIIVASASLGTINSTVLTVEYANQLGIKIRGIILNGFEKGNLLHEDNKILVEKLTGVSVVACVENDEDNIEIEILELQKLYSDI